MSTTASQARALASLTGALVQPYDITDVLARMLEHVTTEVTAQAAGLLVTGGGGRLELLAATSHTTAELELHQANNDEGPCYDAVRQGRTVTSAGERDLLSRWPTVGPAIVRCGFGCVHAEPLRWHGRALGGLNIFFAGEVAPARASRDLIRALADVTTLALVQTLAPSDRELSASIQSALDARALVEQAKGVLLESRGLDEAGAYAHLLSRASEQGVSISELARNLVWQAHSG